MAALFFPLVGFHASIGTLGLYDSSVRGTWHTVGSLVRIGVEKKAHLFRGDLEGVATDQAQPSR